MKRYLQFLGILIILLSAGYIFLVHTVMPPYIRQMLPQIEAMAPEYINGSISIGDLTWDGGLSAEISDVTVKDAEGREVATLPRTIVTVRPWLALDTPARALSRVELVRPQVYLTMDDADKWNMQHLLKPSDSEETPFYGLLEITDGRLQVTMPQGQWDFGVAGTLNGGANPNFAVDVTVKSGVDLLKLSGLMATTGEGRLQLQTEQLDLAAYAPLAQRYASIAKLQGGLGKTALLYVNKDGSITYSGATELVALKGEVTAAGAAHELQLDGRVRAQENQISIPGLAIVADGQPLQLVAEADLRNTDEPKGEGVLTAEQLVYDAYTVTNLRLPFRGSKDTLQLQAASAAYGGGTITANASYSMEEQAFSADVALENITQPLSENMEQSAHINGRVAVLAKQVEDKLRLHGAADTLDISWGNLNINKITFDGAYNEQGLQIEHFSAFAGDKGSVAASGTIAQNGALQLRGRMSDFPIDPVLELAAGQQGSGLCSTGFSVGGTLQAPEFTGMVQVSRAEFMNQKIKEAHGIISMKNNILGFRNFRANMDQGQHTLNGTVNLQGAEPMLDLALETNGVRIEPLIGLVAPGVSVTGNLDNVVQVQGTPSHPYVYGEVHASDGSAVSQLFNSVDGRYIYEDGALQLRNFVVNAFYARLKLDGTMTAEQQLDFELDASNVDLAHLPIKDETVDLDGLVNAKGRLTGTLTKPYFAGDVASDRIAINGEALTELQGTLAGNAQEQNKFNISFKQPYRDDELNYGLYSADINLDMTQRFLQGRVETMWGDIGGLLRMARYDYDINGQMQGRLDFSPQGKGSGILINVTADDVKIHDLNYAHMNFIGSMKKGVLSFEDVKLQEQDGVTDKGLIAVGGYVDLPKQQLNVEVGAVKANPAVVTAVMKDPPEIKGETDMLVQVEGSFDNPHGMGSLEITNGSVAGVVMDKLTAMLTLENDNIKLQQLIANRDAYSVQASGDIPLDLFRSKEQRHNPNAQMNIVMDMNQAQLGILPAMTKMVEWGVGDTQGEVRVAGTLEEPLLYGSLKIEGGSVKVKDINTVLDNIHLDVDFQGNTVLLRDLSTTMGKGRLVAEGSYALHTDAETAYSLHVKAENAELASLLATGRINSDVTIEPQRYPDFANHDGNGPPPLRYRPLIKGTVRLDDVLVNMPTIPELGEGSSNIGMDLAIELGPKIHLHNSYLYDIWLSGGIKIKGSTMWPNVEGTIRADKGTITYLRTDFKISSANLVWVDTGSFMPNVNLESRARFSRYNIFMRVNGPVTEMDLQLTSDPPMEKNTIVRMLTLQRDSAGSNEVTSEDMTNLMTAGLQMTVLGDVEMMVKQGLGLDQFRIYTGKVRSGIGFESAKDRNQELTQDERNQYNVLVSKYLNNNFMIGYTTSFDAVDRSIFGQYDISRHMNITYSRSYDLSSQTEDWYGLEYKISF